jgi:hypothetical protein
MRVDVSEEQPNTGDRIMLRLLANLIAHHAPTPEKQAERELKDLRMDLFQAEQHVIDAQIRADYFRARLAFVEEVMSKGVEQVSDQRKGCSEEREITVRPGLKLKAAH